MTFLQILQFSYSTKPVLWFSFYYCYLRKKGHPSQRGRGLFTRALYCQTFHDTDFSTLHVYAGGFSAAQSRDSYFLCSDRELCTPDACITTRGSSFISTFAQFLQTLSPCKFFTGTATLSQGLQTRLLGHSTFYTGFTTLGCACCPIMQLTHSCSRQCEEHWRTKSILCGPHIAWSPTFFLLTSACPITAPPTPTHFEKWKLPSNVC